MLNVVRRSNKYSLGHQTSGKVSWKKIWFYSIIRFSPDAILVRWSLKCPKGRQNQFFHSTLHVEYRIIPMDSSWFHIPFDYESMSHGTTSNVDVLLIVYPTVRLSNFSGSAKQQFWVLLKSSLERPSARHVDEWGGEEEKRAALQHFHSTLSLLGSKILTAYISFLWIVSSY